MTFLQLVDQYKKQYKNEKVILELLFFASNKVKNLNDYLTLRNSEIDISLDLFEKLLQQYFDFEKPLAYIIGKTYFKGLEITITDGIFIPRPETEMMIDLAKDYFLKDHSFNTIDLCSGSGAIALAIKKEFPKADVSGIEKDNKAFDIELTNKSSLNLDVNFIKEDFFNWINTNNKTYDLITFNPPYIDIKDQDIDSNVIKYEPSQALYAKQNGLEFYYSLFSKAKKLLNKDGIIIAEFGWKQANSISTIVKQFNLQYEIKLDYNGYERFIIIKR